MNRRQLACVTLFCLQAPALLADQISLKNGDRVTGAVIKKDGDKLTFKSEVFGEVTVPWDA